jgi:hypothetical protein
VLVTATSGKSAAYMMPSMMSPNDPLSVQFNTFTATTAVSRQP